MSDVHGRKRVKDPEESIKARREKEASKITEYRDLVQQCHEKMNAKEYTQETLAVITQILRSNPDYYTIWNMRRIVLLEGILPLQESEDQRRKIFLNELDLFMQLIRINPKSYWLWNHRSWCLETMPKPNWTGELELVSKMLSLDARNFHGWGYRRYVVAQLRASADEAETAQISQREFEFTTQKINQNFSNYSAWHQRSKTLPEIVEKMSTEERNAVAQNELDIIKAAVYTDPDDQSAWLYYWWLIGRGTTM
ncbi:uncharacterized protein BYT42DRAFT_554221 [Radiomyces spectabilis]|uniref:uncharacterized protein n=1 Tax=Radiomyces spectabilis TaxID=64574 RepID=UPI00221FCAC9|nr:uncharacterized protein BYT42DRAFT_554221 [Radiomyces spectabilis]KAI8394326.1 hypothetical protein BYT42DRAFT_554221 [Radiomyces spectabilis]